VVIHTDKASKVVVVNSEGDCPRLETCSCELFANTNPAVRCGSATVQTSD
jgi:hypothetical protein